jgi:hypothetical protein
MQTSSLDSPFSDGNKHRYLLRKETNNATGLDVYQDANAQAKTTGSDQAFSDTIDFDVNPVQIGRMQFNGGFDTDYLNGIVDDIVIYSSALSSSEIQDDYDIQPWS